ncbi:MAG: sigma-70 family RNA polymerase sigma factor [Planctomycetes bacterium]|nr:sigma-70 family RNA polymerase sigma factor [Planctomycetota bacterium]
MAPDGSDVSDRITALVHAAEAGDDTAIERLIPLVYDELRALARFQLGRLPVGGTIQATALVHEAWCKLVRGDNRWESKEHFFGAAARAMRNVLVDEARRKSGTKRGGGRRRVTLDEGAVMSHEPSVDVLALDDALDRLERHDERKYRVVMLRYFAGLTIEETARALDLAGATVERDWAYARGWLFRELAGDDAVG